ncbi:MAG: hypothetical protein KatS3mg107_0525 [Gemmataceae bacterium]|nr:MAG: hypothetical protein KatS3mg107_0525 [Gemmataceae bacterium]
MRSVAMRLTGRMLRQERTAVAQAIVTAQLNPPLIDRCLRKVRPEVVQLLSVMACCRKPVWERWQLLAILAALGIHDGPAILKEALEYGLVFPFVQDCSAGTASVSVARGVPGEETRASPPYRSTQGSNPLALASPPSQAVQSGEITPWLEVMGGAVAHVFLHPAVGERIRSRPLPLPCFAGPESEPGAGQRRDGWDWPLRLAAVWQRVRDNPVRLTQEGEFYKKDIQRLHHDPVFEEGWEGGITPSDAGILALSMAVATGLLERHGDSLRAAPFPPCWRTSLPRLLVELFPHLVSVERWDPLLGRRPQIASEAGITPSAGWLILLLLAAAPENAWIDPADLAAWLWNHHPHWAGVLPPAEAQEGGRGWVERWLHAIPLPLQMVEVWNERVRLTPLGRWYFQGAGESELPIQSAFPQTLLVQPNAEIIAYRQGLCPSLVADLSVLAWWKRIGPACVLELQESSLHLALEGEWTLPQILQTLQRHASHPLPATVLDLLERWGSKRERLAIFPSAVIVEFASSADVELALAQGWIRWRLGERFGMTADGSEPDLRHFRLLANRNYETPPQPCLRQAEDGLTLEVDPIQADLFVDLEVGRIAELCAPSEPSEPRRYRITAERLRQAVETSSLEAIDTWLIARSGAPLSPAARLLVLGPHWPPLRAERLLVIRLPAPEAADGLLQWPATRHLIAERLGPTTLAIAPEHLPPLRLALQEAGLTLLEDLSAAPAALPPTSPQPPSPES